MSSTRGSRTDPAEQSDGALFDRYYDSLLGGDAEEPDAFFARHPTAGAEVRQRIRTVYHALERSGSATPPPPNDGLPFERLGEFRLLRRLGEGGMGSVYEARQESLGRVVALKVVRAEFRSSPGARARFEREAAVVARLRHPNVVTVHAFGEEDGVGYLAMEFIPGRGLDEVQLDAVSTGVSLPAADVIRWGAEIARALACVHAAGIVHRDVKPSNIRITPQGRAVLLDFGVARDDESDRLTMTGPLVGSPLYAAPEQIAGGRDVDQRTDVYGLGATLYECLAGRPVVERGTVEQVIHRKMHTEPIPLGRLRERLARDLHVVVMKALERAPERRYATAAEFADDLEAVLAFQPVKARPPGPVARVRAWARRRPAAAATVASLAAALLLAVTVGVLAEVADRRERRQSARDLVAAAGERVQELTEARERARQIEGDVTTYLGELEAKYLPDDHIARLDAAEIDARRLRQERQEAVYGVLEMLRRAEQLDPEVGGADAVRASLYLERYYGARTWYDEDSARFFRQKVLELDPGGEAVQRLTAIGQVTLITDPPGATVHVFRYLPLRELDGQTSPRQVPVPMHAPQSTNAGRWGLRVVDGAGTLTPESLIVAVDGEAVDATNHRRLRERVEQGGAAARVLEGSTERDLTLPGGAVVRPTAAPLLVGADSEFGSTPLRDEGLGGGDYVLLVRHPGHEDVRVFLPIGSGIHCSVELPLHPVGTTPPGFVRVIRGDWAMCTVDVWLMEREVTSEEYLTFLNDAKTRALLGGDGSPSLVPRGPDYPAGYWKRAEGGAFALPETWSADWPAVGVSYDDALAYAAWMTGERPPPDGWEYTLPPQEEWLVAGGASDFRDYTFGSAFRPRWCRSCFTEERSNVADTLDRPIDEGPSGAYDLCGSAMEWSTDWWEEARGHRRLFGGSWAQGDPDVFRLWGGSGRTPSDATGELGFRLMLRRIEDRR